MSALSLDVDSIDFEKGGGLVCAIAQDYLTRQVLMVAWMDKGALEETLASGEATFFSRSRNERWRKGETSGNRLKVIAITADCDNDAILMQVDPAGPACHLGTTSCFANDDGVNVGQLGKLERTIVARAQAPKEESHTARLMAKGPKRIAQKVGEEGVETALAGAAGDAEEVCDEAADLLYHLLVLLHARQAKLTDVLQVLADREAK